MADTPSNGARHHGQIGRHAPIATNTPGAQTPIEARHAQACIVCEPLEATAQTIEGMCKRGHLDHEIDLKVCGGHEGYKLRETSKDVGILLNTALTSPVSQFAGLILRGGRCIEPAGVDRPERRFKDAKFKHGTWLLFRLQDTATAEERRQLAAYQTSMRFQQQANALARMKVAAQAIAKAREALTRLSDEDFKKIRVPNPKGGEKLKMSPKRFVAGFGAWQVKKRAGTILRYLTNDRCLCRAKTVKDRKKALTIAVELVRNGPEAQG